ncbi:MAG: hypothetical protein ACRDMZ_05835, partial [Solirubrobacteraceae bacterium]
LRLLDAAEIAKEKALAARIAALSTDDGQGAQDGRWLAFRATQPFPAASTVTVELAAGAPSAEGPNKTPAAQSFAFRTYAPLKIEKSECGYRGECRPGMPFVIQLNNPIDADKLDASQLAIEPAIPDVQVIPQGPHVYVQGVTAPHTRYRVVVSGKLADEFGQTLGKDHPLSFEVGAAYPTFFGPAGIVVLDPAAKRPALQFFSTNYEQLKVKLYRATEADYDGFVTYLNNQWNHDHPPKMPGTPVFDRLVKVTGGADRLVETSVDLAPALAASGLGHAIAIVEPYPWTESYQPPRMVSWVQSTKLAVDAHVDRDSMVAFVSDLATGKPAGGVALEIRPFGVAATTAADGTATLALSPSQQKGARALIARRAGDVSFVTNNGGWGADGGWVRQGKNTSTAWYVTDDRRMYRPGEEVSLKGWLRLVDPGKNGDIGSIAGQVSSVSYRVADSRGNQLLTGSAPVDA